MLLKFENLSTKGSILALTQLANFVIGVLIQIAFSITFISYGMLGYLYTGDGISVILFLVSIVGLILTGFVGQIVAIIFYKSLNLRLFSTLQRWYRRGFVLFVVLAFPFEETLWYEGLGAGYLYIFAFLFCYFIVELLVGFIAYRYLWRRIGREHFFFHELSIEVIIAKVIRKITKPLREEINKYEWKW